MSDMEKSEEIAVTQLRHEAALTAINQVTETQIEKEVRIEITPAYESFKDREMTFLLVSSLEIFKTAFLWIYLRLCWAA